MTWLRVIAPLAVAALACSAACNSSSTQPTTTGTSSSGVGVAAYILTANGSQAPVIPGTLHTGVPPVASGGPASTVSGVTTIVQSGANVFVVQSTVPFTQVLLTVGGVSPAASGYWEFDLPTATTNLPILLQFAGTIPSTTFSLGFQVSSGAAVGPAATIGETVTTNFSSVSPSVVVTYVPSPAPFLSGVGCTLSSALGCLWEFKAVLQEFNGIAVNNATYTETFTFPASSSTNTLTTTLPARGLATIVRSLSCGVAGSIACATPDQLLGGTYTFVLTGTDSNGNAFTLNGPILTLLPG